MGPGGAREGEILERTLILPKVGMERTIASRDFSCVSICMGSRFVDWIGGRVKGAPGCFCMLCGLGGGPIVMGEGIPGPMKSGLGSELRRLRPPAV